MMSNHEKNLVQYSKNQGQVLGQKSDLSFKVYILHVDHVIASICDIVTLQLLKSNTICNLYVIYIELFIYSSYQFFFVIVQPSCL